MKQVCKDFDAVVNHYENKKRKLENKYLKAKVERESKIHLAKSELLRLGQIEIFPCLFCEHPGMQITDDEK